MVNLRINVKDCGRSQANFVKHLLFETTEMSYSGFKIKCNRCFRRITMWWLKPLRYLRRANARVYCMHDPLDHVTGIEKRELLAHLAGDCDPFRMMAIKKGILNQNSYIQLSIPF